MISERPPGGAPNKISCNLSSNHLSGPLYARRHIITGRRNKTGGKKNSPRRRYLKRRPAVVDDNNSTRASSYPFTRRLSLRNRISGEKRYPETHCAAPYPYKYIYIDGIFVYVFGRHFRVRSICPVNVFERGTTVTLLCLPRRHRVVFVIAVRVEADENVFPAPGGAADVATSRLGGLRGFRSPGPRLRRIFRTRGCRRRTNATTALINLFAVTRRNEDVAPTAV